MQEPLEISYRDVNKTSDIHDLIESKAARLERFCNYIVSCHVAVSAPHEAQDTGSGYRVRIECRVPPSHQLVTHEHSSHGNIHEELPTVIRKAFEAMERQLKELVERQREQHIQTH